MDHPVRLPAGLLITLLLLLALFSAPAEAAAAEDFSDNIVPAKALKSIRQDMPVMTQRFGADPGALVYDGRVYLYMTGDVLETDSAGQVRANSYSRITTLNVISSDDLINWTDHGWITVTGAGGVCRWGSNAWAPAPVCKEINGETKFFLYFANGGNGIGVLTADSPLGPFTDPLGKALVSRATPNCGSVTWLFDPAVLVDEDGSAYLCFGGGIPGGADPASPGTARVVRLGDDMISLDGDPVTLDVPYLFEDSGINRIGDTYYYTYCSNWQMTEADKRRLGFDNAQIVCMTSDSPMGPFTLQGAILQNPGSYFGCYGNNHHSIFRFGDAWYIAFHTQMLEKPLGISGGYRSTSVSRLDIDGDGKISLLRGLRRDQLSQVRPFDPYRTVNAATMSTMAGLDTVPADPAQTCGDMLVTAIDPGDWLAVRGADFGEDGASAFTFTLRPEESAESSAGMIRLCLDGVDGPVIGAAAWNTLPDDGRLTIPLTGEVSGVHDLVLLFGGSGYALADWSFTK